MNPREMANRVMMMFGRGVLRAVTDTGGRQTVQAEMLKGELIDGMEHAQNYGFTSHAQGGDVIVGFVGGNREQGVVLVVDDRRYRIALQAGEVAMYDDLGNKVELLRDMVKVTAVQHLQAEAPTTKLISAVTIEGSLNVQGNVATTGTITNNGKNIGSTHQHVNSGGAGLGGVPQ